MCRKPATIKSNAIDKVFHIISTRRQLTTANMIFARVIHNLHLLLIECAKYVNYHDFSLISEERGIHSKKSIKTKLKTLFATYFGTHFKF